LSYGSPWLPNLLQDLRQNEGKVQAGWGGEKLKQLLDHVAGVCSGLACKVKLNPNRTSLHRSSCYPRLVDRMVSADGCRRGRFLLSLIHTGAT